MDKFDKVNLFDIKPGDDADVKNAHVLYIGRIRGNKQIDLHALNDAFYLWFENNLYITPMGQGEGYWCHILTRGEKDVEKMRAEMQGFIAGWVMR